MEMEEAKLKDKKTGQDASRDLIRWVLFLGDLHLPSVVLFSFCIRS